jgi:hypothetical protein|nr:MAG TPA: hypothetical protein [Caudoviricetes sp.]
MMKLFSQLSTDEAGEVTLRIATPITNLIEDENLVAEVQKTMPKGETTRLAVKRFGLAKIVNLLNIAIKQHRTDVYEILSAFNGLTAEEIGKQNFLVTCKQVSDLLHDKDFVDFFKSSLGGEQNK